MPTGLEHFAKKETVAVPEAMLSGMKVTIPAIYYWETVENGKRVLMTMAFLWRGMPYGMSYPIETENVVRLKMDRTRLFHVVKESLDVLVHHGEKVVDGTGNINPTLVADEEAIRYRFDPHWHKKVAAFNQLVRVVPISQKKAKELKLI